MRRSSKSSLDEMTAGPMDQAPMPMPMPLNLGATSQMQTSAPSTTSVSPMNPLTSMAGGMPISVEANPSHAVSHGSGGRAAIHAQNKAMNTKKGK